MYETVILPLSDRNAVLEIIEELEEVGLALYDDYSFEYYHSSHWAMVISESTGDRFAVFRFRKPALATLFRLKYAC